MNYRIVPKHHWATGEYWELQRKRWLWWCWVTTGSKVYCEQVYQHLIKPKIELRKRKTAPM